jgi:hypothetical protein
MLLRSLFDSTLATLPAAPAAPLGPAPRGQRSTTAAGGRPARVRVAALPVAALPVATLLAPALLGAASLLCADRAAAQDAGGSAAMSEQAVPTEGEEGPASLSDEQALYEEGNRPAAARDSTDPYEDPGEGYYFLGAFYRHVVVPKFIQNLFVDGGATVSNPGFGVQFEYRKAGFSIVGSVWWQDFGFSGPFRESGDPDVNTEIIDSNWSSLFASASFLWSTAFNDMFAIEYGIDVGLGVVLGSGRRTEAYPGSDVGGYNRCRGPTDPRADYCAPTRSGGATDPDGSDGEHYNVVARKWSDGGNVPNVVPWLGLPHIALRFKPIRQLQIRVDGGFFGGFWFGGSLSYGF